MADPTTTDKFTAIDGAALIEALLLGIRATAGYTQWTEGLVHSRDMIRLLVKVGDCLVHVRAVRERLDASDTERIPVTHVRLTFRGGGTMDLQVDDQELAR